MKTNTVHLFCFYLLCLLFPIGSLSAEANRPGPPAAKDVGQIEEEDLAIQRKTFLLAAEYHARLSERVEALTATHGKSRNLEAQEVLLALERKREEAREQLAYHARMLDEMEQTIAATVEQQIEEGDSLPEVAPRRELLEKHQLGNREISEVLAEYKRFSEREDDRFESFNRFLNEQTKNDYLTALQKVEEETQNRLYHLYARWDARAQTGYSAIFNRPPPPPPGYEDWKTSPAAQTSGGTGTAPPPVAAPGAGGRNAQSNTQAQADELRELAAKETDPELKRIYIEQAEKLEGNP